MSAKSNRPQPHYITSTLRILAGRFKGRAFSSPRLAQTHPMGAREKLALFNMLQTDLPGATVLDAYAGSGALGLEALSRGATQVTFVEQSAAVMRILRQNLRAVLPTSESHRTNLIQSSVSTYISRCRSGGLPAGSHLATAIDPPLPNFDLILADPPYDDFNPDEITQLATLLSPRGILVLSFPSTLEPPILPGLALVKSHCYAGAGLAIYRMC